MQDRICQIDQTLLRRTAGPYIRVMCVRFHRGPASNLFRSDPKRRHSVVHVHSAALCHEETSSHIHSG